MKTDSMKNLFFEFLKDMLCIENQNVQVLQQVIENVHSGELRELVKGHLEDSRSQANRLKEELNNLGESSTSTDRMNLLQGLSSELQEFMKEGYASPIRDAAIIALLQRVEHIEISIYGTLHAFAKVLNHRELAEWLHKSSQEEGTFDKALTKLAEGSLFNRGINRAAKKAA